MVSTLGGTAGHRRISAGFALAAFITRRPIGLSTRCQIDADQKKA
jgi:hypothetical protein